MASEWVYLTTLEDRKPIHVNIANALSIMDIDGGSVIWFPTGGEDDNIEVVESAEAIFKKLLDSQSANRA
jgi:hypothetical protein